MGSCCQKYYGHYGHGHNDHSITTLDRLYSLKQLINVGLPDQVCPRMTTMSNMDTGHNGHKIHEKRAVFSNHD